MRLAEQIKTRYEWRKTIRDDTSALQILRLKQMRLIDELLDVQEAIERLEDDNVKA